MPYSKSAVDKEIRKDPRIGGAEAKRIHALLRGRQETDEPSNTGARQTLQGVVPGFGSEFHTTDKGAK